MSWVPSRAGGHWAQKQRDFQDSQQQQSPTNLLLEQERSQKRLNAALAGPLSYEVLEPKEQSEQTRRSVKRKQEKLDIEELRTRHKEQAALLRALLVAGQFEEWRQKKEEFGLNRLRRNTILRSKVNRFVQKIGGPGPR